MHDMMRDQAAGLLAWNLRPPSRVLAAVVTRRSSASLELLWRLRCGCERLGLDCVVVETDPGSWGSGPGAGAVWLWHTSASALLRWWPPEGGRPLVALSAQPAALVEAYQIIKVLHQDGLQPVVVALPEEADASDVGTAKPAPGPLQAAQTALLRTCKTHLGWAPTIWTLGYHERDLADPTGEAVLCRALEAAWALAVPDRMRMV